MEPTYLLATLPLFVAPLSLLVAALVLAVLPARDGRRNATIAAGSLLVAVLVLLASAPPVLSGNVVLDPTLRMFRSGSLDVLLGCVLDKVSLAAAVGTLVCVGGFVAAAAARNLSQRQLAVALAIGGAALTAALGEGFPTLLFGLSLTFWLAQLARESEPPLRLRSLAFSAGIVSAVFAVAFMFWSLGGQWLDDTRYLSDFRARFAVTSAQTDVKRASGMPIGQGKLTIVSHPGARVYLGVVDEEQLKRSDPVGETPLIRKLVPAGLQKVAIEPGGSAIVGGEGVEIALMDTIEVREDTETVISLVGPTVTFHELASALRAGTFASRRMGQTTVGVVVGALLCFSACAFMLAFAERPRSLAAVFGRVCLLIALGALLARLGPLTSASLAFAGGGAVLLAAFSIWSAYRGAGPWFAAAALLAGTAFAGAPLAAVVIAAAIAPGLLAVAELESATRIAEAPAAATAATKGRKKRKSKSTNVAPPASPGETAMPLTLTRLALGLAPIPLLGAFAGLGSAIATPFSSSFGRGILFWLALALTWAAFAWSLQQSLSKLVGANLEAPAVRRVSVLAGIGMVAGPLSAILLRPWQVSAAFGPTLAVIVAVAASTIVLITAPLAVRHMPLPSTEPGDPVVSPIARVDALLEKLDLLLGLPLALVARIFSRGEKGEPS